jgi:hypothetical protein
MSAFAPFKGNPGGPDTPATLRIATAAEYIAEQLGVIALKAVEIESHLARLERHGGAQHVQPEIPAEWSAARQAFQAQHP